MKIFKYLTIAVMAISLASCGGKKNSDENEKNRPHSRNNKYKR